MCRRNPPHKRFYINQMRYGSMKVTKMPPVHVRNLVANSGSTAYGVENIAQQDIFFFPLQWHQTKCNGISNHQCLNCLITGLFRHRSKKASKVHVTGLCEGNSPVTPDILSLMDTAWTHHKYPCFCILPLEFGVNIDIQKHENSKVLC